MGATDFFCTVTAANAKKAFEKAKQDAKHEHGHGGYTGTIAEKHEFVVLRVPAGTDPKDFVNKVCDDESHGYEDKWGPALCVEVSEGKFCFFGLASC